MCVRKETTIMQFQHRWMEGYFLSFIVNVTEWMDVGMNECKMQIVVHCTEISRFCFQHCWPRISPCSHSHMPCAGDPKSHYLFQPIIHKLRILQSKYTGQHADETWTDHDVHIESGHYLRRWRFHSKAIKISGDEKEKQSDCFPRSINNAEKKKTFNDSMDDIWLQHTLTEWGKRNVYRNIGRSWWEAKMPSLCIRCMHIVDDWI